MRLYYGFSVYGHEAYTPYGVNYKGTHRVFLWH